MAPATEAPATIQAEGPTQHTPNQADTARFTPYQLRMLHAGITPNRVRNLRGMAHLEAWDVRRQLLRIFGFGGYSVDTVSLDLVAEREAAGNGKPRWTVVYRAQVRLTLHTPEGRVITYFEDGAAGDAVNQPSLGDAHDLAMKTALSQALKRCAVNLGDQFGLSLYNDGSRDAVVQFSAAHPPAEWQKTAPLAPEPNDPPVRPEQSAAQAVEEQAPSVPAGGRPMAGADGEFARLVAQAQDAEVWSNPLALTQIRIAAKKAEVGGRGLDAPTGGTATFDQILATRIDELNQQKSQRTEGAA